jgi:hypothetical protein
LAKSFRVGGSLTLTPFAPSDLRIDGGYSERHSAPSYLTSTAAAKLWDFTQPDRKAVISFWCKPSFGPELTGKLRGLWDLSRYHTPCHQDSYSSPLGVFFFPVNDTPSTAESGSPFYAWPNVGGFHPTSLGYGAIQWFGNETLKVTNYVQFGKVTKSLNHLGHPDTFKLSPFKAHRWMNVALDWHLQDPISYDDGDFCDIYINGLNLHKGVSNPLLSNFSFVQMGGWAAGPRFFFWDRHEVGAPVGGIGPGTPGDYNHMRLGNPSRITSPGNAGTPYRGNYSADLTFDELYVWDVDEYVLPWAPTLLWSSGRYAHLTAGQPAKFTSQPVSLTAAGARGLAPASTATAPIVSSAPPPVPITPPLVGTGASIKVLGMSWTWHGEAVDAQGKRLLYEYLPGGMLGPDVKPRVRLALLDGGLPPYGPYDNDGFSAVRDTQGKTPAIQNPAQIKYQAQFVLDDVDLSSILLATPVLDDVTLYWDDGRAPVVSYVYDTRSF